MLRLDKQCWLSVGLGIASGTKHPAIFEFQNKTPLFRCLNVKLQPDFIVLTGYPRAPTFAL